jgi:hypothetical protein
MEAKNTYEHGICFYQNQARDFSPITVSANFAALECPKCVNNVNQIPKNTRNRS